jgi:hypothetical protein
LNFKDSFLFANHILCVIMARQTKAPNRREEEKIMNPQEIIKPMIQQAVDTVPAQHNR